VPGATILSLCQKGDELLEAETAKIFKGKKTSKGSDLPPIQLPINHRSTRLMGRGMHG